MRATWGRPSPRSSSDFRDLGFRVLGFLDDELAKGRRSGSTAGSPSSGPLADLGPVIEGYGISEVYVALDLHNYAKIIETFQIIDKYPVHVRLIPDLFQLLTLKANIQDLDGFPVISVDDVPLQGAPDSSSGRPTSLVSALLLVLLAPFILIVAVLIKLTSRGPVFYHQERVSLDGRRFVIHKFRTMVCDAEKATGPVMCGPPIRASPGSGGSSASTASTSSPSSSTSSRGR